MKKLIKQISLIAIMLILVFALTGCGNKMIATKTIDEDGVKAKLKYEIQFENDKVSNIKMITEYESKEDADEAFESLEFINTLAENEEDKLNIEQDGNKVIMVLTGEQYGELSTEEEMTKKAIKANLEEEGFKVR